MPTARSSVVAGLPLIVTAVVGAAGLLLISITAGADHAPGTRSVKVAQVATVPLVDDDNDHALFTLNDLYPGGTATNCLAVTATEGGTGEVRLSAANLSGFLLPAVQVQIEAGTGGGFSDCTGFTGRTIYTGALSGLAGGDTAAPGVTTDWTPAAGAETRTFRVAVTIVGGNQFQGATAQADLQWLRVVVPPTSATPSHPATPHPSTPQPGTPQPSTTQPGTTQPGTPEPGTPQPGTPEPGTPEPGAPETPTASTTPASTVIPTPTPTPASGPTSSDPASIPAASAPESATASPSAGPGPSVAGNDSGSGGADGGGTGSGTGHGKGGGSGGSTRGSGAKQLGIDLLAMTSDAAQHPWYLLCALAAMWMFLLVVGRFDRRDPKLALAPMTRDPYLRFPHDQAGSNVVVHHRGKDGHGPAHQVR